MDRQTVNCCDGEFNGFGVECDDDCKCRECDEQRSEVQA